MATAAVPKAEQRLQMFGAALRASADALAAAVEVLKQVSAGIEQAEAERATAPDDPAFSIKETAAGLGISSASVRNLIKSGRLKAEHHGGTLWRVRRSEIQAYLRRIAGGSPARLIQRGK